MKNQQNKSCSEIIGNCFGESFYGSNKYSGDWYNGVPHGNGVIYLGNNEKIEGEFVNGSANGSGSWYLDEHRLDGSGSVEVFYKRVSYCTKKNLS
tara:strand:- start:36 stop:320 length:285 start_codon:yes stop_codon:yes gene_type:complete